MDRADLLDQQVQLDRHTIQADLPVLPVRLDLVVLVDQVE